MRRIITHRYKAPLQSGRKACAATAFQVRILNQRSHSLRRHLAQNFSHRLIAARLLVFAQAWRRSIYADVFRERSLHLCRLPFVSIEYGFDLVSVYVAMKIVADHQNRRVIARTQADVWYDREAPVSASLSQFCTEQLRQPFAHAVITHNPATHAVANPDHMLSDRPAENLVVERCHAVQFIRRHFQKLCQFANALVRDPPTMPLDNFQGFNAHGLFAWIVMHLSFYFVFDFFRQHRTPTRIANALLVLFNQRSTSAST